MEALYRALLAAGIASLRTEPPFFRWASGQLSPLYLDFRHCLAHPPLRKALIEQLMAVLRDNLHSFGAVAGVATGGISWAAWLADRLEMPMGYVRSSPKPHGTGQTIEGLRPAHGPVLLIEDVLSTGQSLSTAAAHLQNEGFCLTAAAVLWDYCLPKRASFALPVVALLSFPEALRVWQAELPAQAYEILTQWYRTLQVPS